MPRNRSRSLAAALFMAAASAATVGCDSGPALVTVTGTVTMEGKPVSHAAVQFSPNPSNAVVLPGEAVTDADGHYRLISDERNGAVPGKYHVVISRAAGEPPSAPLPSEASEAFKDDPFMAALSSGAGSGAPAAAKKSKKGPIVPDAGTEFTFDIEVAGKGGAIDFVIKPEVAKTASRP
ncbi:carboxypeptidase-like regulatory domain-containing protein [Paludisphaera sp.]|uniref:carboxypeptidase-like regulatory domain-containing protein n=1 Tax=Paludisphaera sp. TaxID=2017432 RepID=UPI00301C7FAF